MSLHRRSRAITGLIKDGCRGVLRLFRRRQQATDNPVMQTG